MPIPIIPEAAVGAVVSASIGGLLAFLSLVIAKENKTSEFRHAWIDSLRQDLARMIASATAIRGAVSVGFESKEDLFKATEKHFVDINQAATSIRLKLNQTEDACKPILDGIDHLEQLMIDSNPIDLVECMACEKKILVHSRMFLKNEWKRVRRGETIFYITKWIGLAVILNGVAWLLWTAIQG